MYTKDTLRKLVDEIGPWHYSHQFPFGIQTGKSPPDRLQEQMVEMLANDTFPRSVYPFVLDLGANSGYISMWFVDEKDSVVTALEGGPKYFPQLELAVEVKGYSQSIVPIRANLYDLPAVSEAYYDLVLFLGVLHHLKEEARPAILSWCRRALIPGGEIVVQTKTDLPVIRLLKEAGFENPVKSFDLKNHPKSVWRANRDPMKL